MKRLLLIYVAIAGAISSAGHAQTSAPPTTPLPPQIHGAKTIYLANALDGPNDGTEHTYNLLYTALQHAGFSLTFDPQKADLIAELGSVAVPAAVNNGFVTSDISFRIRLLQPKNHVLLWSLAEAAPQGRNKRQTEQLYIDSLTHLAADLKALTDRPESAVSAQP